MKKRYYIIFIVEGVVLLLLFLFIFCNKDNCLKREFTKTFNLKIDNSKLDFSILYYKYGGFHHDGQALYKIEYREKIKFDSSRWKDLPLSVELFEFFYSNGAHSLAEQINLPTIKKGKWYFVNRGDKDFTNAYAYNFSLCFYDDENNVFYYYKIDT